MKITIASPIGILPAIALSAWLSIGYSQSTDPANAQTGSAAEIQGAFGLKLGDTFDVSKGKLIIGGKREGDILTPEILLAGEYEFKPEGPLRGFTKYSVDVTPLTHKIACISAVGPYTNFSDQIEVVQAALVKKYGGQPKDGSYRREIGNRYIAFAYFSVFEGTGEPQPWVRLHYGDSEVARAGQQERERIIESQQAAQQREIENKAKALEKSGL